MRISFILSSLWLSGGVRVIVEYANRLTIRNHKATLIAPRGTLDPDVLGELDARVDVRESWAKQDSTLRLHAKAQLSWSLAQAVPPSDVVISTHTPTTVAGLLATRLLKRGQLVWLYQDFREQFADRPLEDWLLRNALSWHKCALAVSEYSQRELMTYARGKVIVVGEGLSHAELFRPLPAHARPSAHHQRTVMFLGDMRPRKGLNDFLQAASIVYDVLRDIKLLIISKEKCDIETDIPFEYIHRPTRRELAQHYAACDLFVSASWRESFGLPPLEAMACGAPVVLSDSGGVREYARSGENCLMVNTHDPQDLAKAMLRVLTDSTLADHLRRNGPPTAACFTWDSAVDRFEHALCSLILTNEH